jgi:hypothetical protein
MPTNAHVSDISPNIVSFKRTGVGHCFPRVFLLAKLIMLEVLKKHEEGGGYVP